MMDEFKAISYCGPAAPCATHSKIMPALHLTCIHEWHIQEYESLLLILKVRDLLPLLLLLVII